MTEKKRYLVEITKASRTSWYANKLGKKYWVRGYSLSYWICINYCLFILKNDTIIEKEYIMSNDKEDKQASKDKKDYEQLGKEIGRLVGEKNKAYGNSFAKCDKFLRLCFPDGVKPEQYSDMLCMVRVFDKLMRIASNKGAFSESPYRDIAGYGILGVVKDARKESKAATEASVQGMRSEQEHVPEEH